MGQHPAKVQSQRADLLQPISLPCPDLVERFSIRSSSVAGSQLVMTSSRPTTSPSSSLHQSVSGCALMSPRPKPSSAPRRGGSPSPTICRNTPRMRWQPNPPAARHRDGLPCARACFRVRAITLPAPTPRARPCARWARRRRRRRLATPDSGRKSCRTPRPR